MEDFGDLNNIRLGKEEPQGKTVEFRWPAEKGIIHEKGEFLAPAAGGDGRQLIQIVVGPVGLDSAKFVSVRAS